MTHALQPYRGSYLMPAFERASVADVMRPGVMSCAPDAPLLTVAQTMATHHECAHLIVTAGGQPVGVISSLDIAGALAWGRA